MSQLQIIDISDNTSHVRGGKKVILVCERVSKEDVKIRLSDSAGWEGWGEFGSCDVHKQCVIIFRTPPYPDTNISQPVKLSLELVRPSDGATSDEEEFFYTPLPESDTNTTRGGSSSSHLQNDLDYEGLELGDIRTELQLNIPVTDLSNMIPITTTTPAPTPTIDVLNNSESDENLLNLSDIMKDLGLKPPLNNSKTGMKRSSKDAENDSASLSYNWKVGGEINPTANDHSNTTQLSEFLDNCQHINDL